MSAGAHAWTECNAYNVSLACVRRLLTANKCDSQSSQPCDELLDYQTDMTAQQSSWCGRAPSALPACPFHVRGTYTYEVSYVYDNPAAPFVVWTGHPMHFLVRLGPDSEQIVVVPGE